MALKLRESTRSGTDPSVLFIYGTFLTCGIEAIITSGGDDLTCGRVRMLFLQIWVAKVAKVILVLFMFKNFIFRRTNDCFHL